MRQLIILSYILSCFLICTSCSNKQYQALFQQRNSISDTTLQRKAVTLNEYRIKSQDVLQVRNLQDIKYIANEAPVSNNVTAGSNSGEGQTFQVEENGTVALPSIGRVQVSGLTRSEAQKKIEDLYRQTLLKNPIIDVKIVNLKVTILGEVKGQGNYVLTKDRTTLVELIGQAGGLTDKADEKNIKIIRGTEKDPEVTEVNLNNIRSINDPVTVLQSGDIIYVAQNKRAARNDNLQNFSFIVQPALILFNTALIVFTLIRR